MEVANRVLKEQGWGAWPSCTNSKFPELKGLKPAPEGTFAGGDGGDSSRSASGGGEGQDLPKTPAEKGNEDGLQVDTVRGMRLVAERFPEVTTIGGVRADDLPDHPSGRAIDVMVGDNTQGKASGDRVADYFIEHAEALNVDYIIAGRQGRRPLRPRARHLPRRRAAQWGHFVHRGRRTGAGHLRGGPILAVR